MGKGLRAGGAGDSVAPAGSGVRAPLTARDLRDLRAVLRAVRNEGGVTLVRLRHFELELQPERARSRIYQSRSHLARDTARGKRAHEDASAKSGRRGSAGPASDTACAPANSACKDFNSACKVVKGRSRRGPAAIARSKARLQAFNDRKREQMLAASQIRARLDRVLSRMRFERMWAVKRAHAEGKEVAPSLSEVMALLLSKSVTQQPLQEATGSKRAATSTPKSPPLQAGSPAVQGMNEALKPSPLKRPRSGRKKCAVCGYMPYTCTCKYKNTGFRRLQLA